MQNNSLNRRDFIKKAYFAVGALTTIGFYSYSAINTPAGRKRKPKRLTKGDTIGVIAPAGAIYSETAIPEFKEIIHGLGYKTVFSNKINDKNAYLAGSDKTRADELNKMFANPEIDAIITMRGGWGCARMLSMIDYKTIKHNPKIIIGYSDITSLLIAIYEKTGLITFHGPVGYSTWNDFSIDYFNRVLVDAKKVTFNQPYNEDDKITTIAEGKATGELVGGNLSVLAGIIGSDYLPKWKNKILFLEEIGEKPYKVDRMLTQLKLAGVFEQINGLIFGKCTDCESSEPEKSFTITEIIKQHLKPYNIPAFYGSMIGHIENKFTIPLGIEAEMDANTGSIKLLEPAVV